MSLLPKSVDRRLRLLKSRLLPRRRSTLMVLQPAPHGAVTTVDVSAVERRTRPLTLDAMLSILSGLPGLSWHHYSPDTDVIHLVITSPTDATAVDALYHTLATRGFEVRILAPGHRRGRYLTLEQLNAELKPRTSLKLQLVDLDCPSTAFSVSLERWVFTAEGHLASPRNNDSVSNIRNFQARGLSEDGGELTELLPAPQLSAPLFDVDWVFTWVDGEDPEWIEMYNQWAPVAKTDGSDSSRFIHRDDLKFALRSLDTYAPWIRRIHIVSNCRPPEWLNTDHERINWVTHEQLFDSAHLPTFSSHAIESVLHRIPGLAEHFVYSNDDFYLARRAYPGDFFAANSICLSKLEPYGMVNGPVTPGDPDYLNAARNSAQLIADNFGQWPVQLHTHSPQACRVSILKEMEDRFPEEFRQTREARFRAVTDIAVTGFLFHHYAFATGKAFPVPPRTLLIQQNHAYRRRFRTLRRQRDYWAGAKVLSFCLNDGNGSMENKEWNDAALSFLTSYFPYQSAYEV